MKKINFRNLPDTSTPLSAGNMNLLQSNIEESTVEVSATQPTNKQAVWLKSSRNLFDKTKVESNKGISASDGKTFDTTSQNATDYIHVKGQEYISSNCISSPSGGTGQYYGAFYDSSKKYVAPAESKNSTSLKIPSNVVYVRLTLKKELMNSLMINFGKELLDYEPYLDKEILTYNGSGYDSFLGAIESGSNAYGNWVKYPDGTMIQYGRFSSAISVTNSAGGGSNTFYQDNLIKILPKNYIDANFYARVNIAKNSWTNLRIYSIRKLDDSSFYFDLSQINGSASGECDFSFFTIGRWK